MPDTPDRPEQTIELDCAPGSTRPGDLIDLVIVDTGLPAREAVSKFFGNWVWDYSDIDPARWATLRPVLKERVELLYRDGLIRYGSW